MRVSGVKRGCQGKAFKRPWCQKKDMSTEMAGGRDVSRKSCQEEDMMSRERDVSTKRCHDEDDRRKRCQDKMTKGRDRRERERESSQEKDRSYTYTRDVKVCCVGHAKRGTDIWWFNTVTWERHCYWAGAACLLWNDFWTQQLSGSGIPTTLTWLWVNTYKLPFLGGWTSIDPSYFWCELQGYLLVLTHCHMLKLRPGLCRSGEKAATQSGGCGREGRKGVGLTLMIPELVQENFWFMYNILQYII